MVKDEKSSPYSIIESDVEIEDRKWDDDMVQLLWARHVLIIEKMFEYWKPYYDRGKKCFDYEKGNIFSSKQKAAYKLEDKIPVEPRIMEPRIYSLVGEIIRGRRSGAITTEGGSFDDPAGSAKACEIASIVMKDMEHKNDERDLEKNILHNALVSCFPNWIWYEMGPPSEGEGVLSAKLLPWDSVAVAPFHFEKVKQVTGIGFNSLMKVDEVKDFYPDMEEQIDDHIKAVKDKDYESLSSIAEFETTMDASDRNRLYSLLADGRSNLIVPDGYFKVMTRVFQLRSREKVAINLDNPDDFHVRPPLWDNERWNSFIKFRQQESKVEYAQAYRKVKILWSTVGTSSGLMLENKKHWYAENGRMPGTAYWPAMIDGDFMGHGEKQVSNVVKYASAHTEFLDEVRKGSGGVWLTRTGFIANVDDFHSEINKSQGNISIKGDWPGDMRNVVDYVQRKPNTSTLEYAQMIKAEIEEEGRINLSIQGASKPDQSGVAKTLEITQGMIAQSEYVENFNNFWEDHQDLKCSLIPYAYSEFDIINIVDEKTGIPSKTEINAPVMGISGDIIGVANDLTAHKFKFRLQPVDDSPTAKQEEQRQAVVFLNSVPGPMAAIDPSGELLSYFMMAMPNRILQDAGRRLLDRARQNAQTQQQKEQTEQLMKANERLQKLRNEAEKIKASKVMFSITGEQLAGFPMLQQLLSEVGYFAPATEVQPPESQGALPAPAAGPVQSGGQMPPQTM